MAIKQKNKKMKKVQKKAKKGAKSCKIDTQNSSSTGKKISDQEEKIYIRHTKVL